MANEQKQKNLHVMNMITLECLSNFLYTEKQKNMDSYSKLSKNCK